MAEAPALRDQHGQSWPWPPLAPDPGPSEGADGASVPSRCWLFFLPGAFTPVCTAELGWVDELAGHLAPAGIGLRVISCDSAPVLRAFGDALGVRTPLLSDFWPHGAAARRVGAFDDRTGRARRTSVLVDAAGREMRRVEAAPGQERRLADHLSGDGVGPDRD
ncbi:redoxin domain-containing protein [Citricoccus sp.]|uniref:redoxin domain-containing protein n=1 Tax=Citricoccus sp. TaxID=1978372 RepID=UPI002D08A493|nr:redoxin domain-containing protein [Citricoccus sp.]HRO93673.1 redoxin domain-containing protein [Citricoccus sp.]